MARGCSLAARNHDGLDAVLSACNGGHLPMVLFLMAQFSCSIDQTNPAGYTPLILVRVLSLLLMTVG